MGRKNIAWRVNKTHKSKTQMQTLPINFLHGENYLQRWKYL